MTIRQTSIKKNNTCLHLRLSKIYCSDLVFNFLPEPMSGFFPFFLSSGENGAAGWSGRSGPYGHKFSVNIISQVTSMAVKWIKYKPCEINLEPVKLLMVSTKSPWLRWNQQRARGVIDWKYDETTTGTVKPARIRCLEQKTRYFFCFI